MVSQNATIDWLTATAQGDDVGYSWFDLYRRIAQEWSSETEERDWSGLGFSGRSTGSPRITWGFRPSDELYILIASGALAHEVWPAVVPAAKNISRVDFAVTVEKKAERLAEYWYRQVVAYPVDRRMTYRLVENNKGGQTLYLGSRQSERFGRLYDKGQEQGGGPGVKWRYEVEYKGGVALTYAKALLSAVNGGEEMGRTISSTVWQFFEGRGVRPVFGPGDGAITAQPEVGLTSFDRKLKWLRNGVRPSVQKLFEAGRGDEALEALGISREFLHRVLKAEDEARASRTCKK